MKRYIFYLLIIYGQGVLPESPVTTCPQGGSEQVERVDNIQGSLRFQGGGGGGRRPPTKMIPFGLGDPSLFLVHGQPIGLGNKGRGMCYPVCGMMHIKEPLLLIDE